MNHALVVSLVRAHLISDPEYMSYVPPHEKIRYNKKLMRLEKELVGAHHRRKAMCKRSIDALACVCKQETLRYPRAHDPPLGRKRNR